MLTFLRILHQHFGLEAYFATTQVNDKNRDRWPKHENHKWHSLDELKTTICYLTMHKPVANDAQYVMAEGMDFVAIDGCESYLVDVPTLEDKASRDARFKRALRILKLKPYVHPSQLNTRVSAASAPKDILPTEPEQGVDKTDEMTTKGETLSSVA